MKTVSLKHEATELDLEFKFINTEDAPFAGVCYSGDYFKAYEANLNWRAVITYDENGTSDTVFSVDSFTATIIREEFGVLADPTDGYEYEEEAQEFDFSRWEMNEGSTDLISVRVVTIDFGNETINIE